MWGWLVKASGTIAAVAITGLLLVHPEMAFFVAVLLLFTAVAGLHKLLRAETLCSNGMRRKILRRALAEPGITLADLARRLGARRQTITYHLNVLRDYDVIALVRDGKTVRVVPADKIDAFHRPMNMMLERAWARPLLDALVELPEASERQVSRRLGVSRSTIRWYFSKLSEAGIAVPTKSNGLTLPLPAQLQMLASTG